MSIRERQDAKKAILYKLRLYFTTDEQETYTTEEIVEIIDNITEEEIMSPRTGRPTDNPKPYRISGRLDEECKQILTKYCEQKNVNQMEAIRRAIKKLETELENK